jgi:Bacterial Ig-like domain (group 3)
MNRPIARSLFTACTGLSLVFACSLSSPRITAQAAQAAITLEPPSGLELQAHTVDAQGNRLPEAPANFRRLGEARVGEAGDVHTLTFRFAETTKVTGIKTTSEFRIEKGGSCEAGNTYQKGSTCTLLTRFTPQGPGNRLGHLTVSTNLSATPMAFGLGGYGYSPIISFIPAVITTVPGTYPSSVGLLSGAQNLTIDGGDTLWVSDTGNGLVRNLDSGGAFKTLASGYTGVLGIAVDTFGQAYFDVPSTGKMYEIYDYGPVVQVSGTGSASCPASTPCTLSAQMLGTPGEMSMDPYNHLFFVDSHQGAAFSTVQPIPANLIYLYDPFPYQTSPSSAMAVDAGDNLYSLWANGGVCEIVQSSLYNAENSNVSFTKVAGGHTCGFAGDGGLAGSAEIQNKIGQIAFDAAGDMYFTDSANQRVRRIDYTTGVIRTIAGNGTAGYTGDNGAATSAKLNNPTGIGVNSKGVVYVISSASSGQVIREIGPTGLLNFGNQGKGVPTGAHLVTVSNTGNSAMTLTNAVITGINASDFKIDSTSTTCILTAGSVLYSGQTCRIGVIFTPGAIGTRIAYLHLLDNTVTGDDDVVLVGTGVLPTPTFKITSPTSGASFTSGTAVTFKVSVTSTTSPAPTGTVQFQVDSANYGSPVTLAAGVASTSVTGLTQTGHTLSATYSGDANYAAAGPVSVSITVTAVKIGASVTLSPTASASSCSPTQFAIAVSSKSKEVPTGQVTLLDGSRNVASGALAGGKVTLSPPPLGAGIHTLTAHYAGDAFHLPAESPALIEAGSSAGSCQPLLPGSGSGTGPRMP